MEVGDGATTIGSGRTVAGALLLTHMRSIIGTLDMVLGIELAITAGITVTTNNQKICRWPFAKAEDRWRKRRIGSPPLAFCTTAFDG